MSGDEAVLAYSVGGQVPCPSFSVASMAANNTVPLLDPSHLLKEEEEEEEKRGVSAVKEFSLIT